MELDALYEDNHCLAVNKPAPLLTQAPTGVPSLEARVREYLREKHGKPGRIYLGVPHRLDRCVTGVIVFARQSKSAARLAEQFRERRIRKTYWVLVEGQVEPETDRWEDWLIKVPGEARAERVAEEHSGARRAVLTYRRLWHDELASLLEIELETGRTHQIRVQASARGRPVRGDFQYGAAQSFGPAAETERERVIAMHARTLTFLHPISYEPVTLTAPISEHWRDVPGLP